jgi:hypothetical protein
MSNSSTLQVAMESNDKAIALLKKGEYAKAVATLSRGLSSLSTRIDDKQDCNDLPQSASQVSGPLNTVVLTSVDANPGPEHNCSLEAFSKSKLEKSLPTIFTRAFVAQVTGELNSIEEGSCCNSLGVIMLFNTALSFHLAALKSAGNVRRLMTRALRLYEQVWMSIVLSNHGPGETAACQEDIALSTILIPLQLAVCTNLTHIYTELYDRERAEATRSIFGKIMRSTHRQHFCCDEEFIFFSLQKWQLEFPVLMIAAAA